MQESALDILESGRQVTDVAHDCGGGKQAPMPLVDVFKRFEFGAATIDTIFIKYRSTIGMVDARSAGKSQIMMTSMLSPLN